MKELKIQGSKKAKALIISLDAIYPDSEVCGTVCSYSELGRIPDPVPLDPKDSLYSIDKGNPGDLCPPCCKSQLGHLGHWQGHGRQYFPSELLSLRLFKCRMWFWVVVVGLYDENPTQISSMP